MKTIRILTKLLVVLALTLAVLGLPKTARAGNIFHTRGGTASASLFSSVGCISTSVFVFSSESVFQDPPGPPDTSSFAFVGIFQFDGCTGYSLKSVFGSALLADQDFQVRRNSARLNAAIPAFDFSTGMPTTVAVNLTWTCTGPLSRSSFNSHFQSPDVIFNSHSSGTFCPAQASGSVSIGPTNFAPGPLSGFLGTTRSGTVVIN